jgi:membrane protein DedA with SNARE-associated domain
MQVAQAAERGGSTVAVGGGMWIWLAQNQEAIAALCAIVGLAVAVAGFAVHWWYLHRDSKQKRNRRKDDS